MKERKSHFHSYWIFVGSAVLLFAVLMAVSPAFGGVQQAPNVAIGAIGALGVISGAIMSHLTQLGIVVNDDGGQGVHAASWWA